MVYFMFFFFFWDTVPFELCRNKKFIRFIKVVRFIFMALSIVFTIIEEGFSHPFILLYLAVSFISQYHLNLRYILSYAGLVLYNIPSLWANIDIEFNDYLVIIIGGYFFITILLDFIIYCSDLKEDEFCETNNNFINTCRLQYKEMIDGQATTAGRDM